MKILNNYFDENIILKNLFNMKHSKYTPVKDYKT